ncbi:MAG: nucleotide exchange factor GrpE [Thermoplasmata archaeon]|nr:nucleotide exchange factor GrpE [Thermoplasmata archaeon]MCI4359828.1 nucleotide exchange factor GrpE [Thermoplasmata archaeon]
MTEEKRAPVEPPADPPLPAAVDPSTPSPAAAGTPTPPAAGEASASDWETRFRYLFADFENYRKRAERDRESVRLRAEGEVLRKLLPIQDSFDRAREFVRGAPPADPIRKGLELLGREWDGFLRQEGIEPVARVGVRFNADEHEVVGEAEPGSRHPPGTVAEVVQQGFRFRGRLLRPAKVLVARPPPPPPGEGVAVAQTTARLSHEAPSE